MAILPHDAWGNPLPRPEDRIKRLSRLGTPAPDPRDAEIAALKARIAELEAGASVTKPVTAGNAETVTPVTRTKLTAAEKQRRYRERLAAAKNKNSTPI